MAQKSIGGVPIAKFIARHNLNNYLVRILEECKAEVDVHETINCLSNAMNVKRPNNIPRILYIFNQDLQKMRELIYPVTVDDKKTAEIIQKVYEEKNYLLDVHSAVSLAGVFEFLDKNPEYKNFKIGAFLTAEPAKFSEKIKNIIGFEPSIPDKLRRQLNSPEKNVFSLQANDLMGLKKIVCQTNLSTF